MNGRYYGMVAVVAIDVMFAMFTMVAIVVMFAMDAFDAMVWMDGRYCCYTRC